MSRQAPPQTADQAAARLAPAPATHATSPSAQPTALQRLTRSLSFPLLAFFYLLPFMRIMLPRTNEGTLIEGAVRALQGQVFARDFFEVMGPGTFYWLALFLKAFGATFFATRLCLLVTSFGTGLLLYFLTCKVTRQYRALPCIILAGTCYGMQWPAISHHVDSNFFALLAVSCVTLWQSRRTSALLIAAGVFAAITTCIHQPKGMLLFAAILAWMLLGSDWTSPWLRRMVPVAIGYLAVTGFVLAYFWHKGALADLLFANYTWPSQNYSAVNTVPYALGIFSQYWQAWATAAGFSYPWAVVASILVMPFLLVAILPALTPALALRRGLKNLTPTLLLYWLCGIALWASEFHRRDIYHLVFGSPLLLVLCVCYLTKLVGRLYGYLLQIIAIASTLLIVFNFAMVLTARSIETRAGLVAVFKTDPTLAFLHSHTSPGDKIFAYPYCPMYYFLTQTENPTRYSILVYNYNTPSQFHEAISDLDQNSVRYIVWDTKFQGELANSLFPGLKRPPPGSLIMENYFESHYRTVQESEGIRVMERKSDGSAPSSTR